MSIHKLFSLSSKPYMSFFLSLFLSKSTEIKDCNILGLEDFDSSCLALAISKPNLIINTDLLIIIWNYLSLICKSEILYPPHLYHYLQILIYYNPWLRSTTRVIRCHWESSRVIESHWESSRVIKSHQESSRVSRDGLRFNLYWHLTEIDNQNGILFQL